MQQVSLRFFGRFQATQGDNTVKISSPKSQGLLAWLAMQPDQSGSREAASALLWSTFDAPRAQQNLRTTIARLRRSVGPVLDSTRWQVALVDGAWACDVTDFLAALGQSKLEDAVALYQGPFLAGVSTDSPPFDEWVLLTRESLHLNYLDALAQLTATAFDNDNYEDALRFASLKVETDSLDEAAYCDMMEAYALMNRPREATALFERLTELLSAELNMQPAAETAAIHQQILDGSYSSRGARVTTAPAQPQHNLPRQHTDFVGRQALLSNIDNHLAKPTCNLLTLHGMGGIGKTRLAIEAARRQLDQFADGVWFVPLAALPREADDSEIVDSVADAAGVTFPSRMLQPDKRQAFLVEQLKDRALLLVLDNYEHLVEHVDFVIALLKEAPKIKLLVTSREPLNLRAEWVLPVAGLAFAAEDERDGAVSAETITAFDAAKLFVKLVQRAIPSYQPTAAVTQLTRLVDGSPLALELAASWMRSLTDAEIVAKIASDLDSLTTTVRDADRRHRSMRVVFNFSWSLLSQQLQRVLADLSIFRGHFSAEAASTVASANAFALTGLIDHSLLRRSADGAFELHPLITQFASEKAALSTTRYAATRHKHASYFLTLIAFPKDAAYIESDDPLIDLFIKNVENMRLAWSTAVAEKQGPLLLGCIDAATRLCSHWGRISLLSEWMQAVEAQFAPESATDAARTLRMYALNGQAHAYLVQSRFADGIEVMERAVSLAQQSDNAATSYAEMRCLASLGELYMHSGEYDSAEASLTTLLSKARNAQQPLLEALALKDLGSALVYKFNFKDALPKLQQAEAFYLREELNGPIRNTRQNIAICLYSLGQLDAAAEAYASILRPANEKLNRFDANIYGNYATVLNLLSEYDQALEILDRAAAVFQEVGDVQGVFWLQNNIFESLTHTGKLWQCYQRFCAFETVDDRLKHDMFYIELSKRRASLISYFGDVAAARALLLELLSVAEEFEYSVTEAGILQQLAMLEPTDEPIEQRLAYANRAVVLNEMTDSSGDQADALVAQGYLLMEMGQDDAGSEVLHKANQLLRGGSRLRWWAAPTAMLAALAANQGKMSEAHALVEDLLVGLGSGPLFADSNAMLVYNLCHQLLRSWQDDRAADVAALAVQHIEVVSAEISDPIIRDIYRNLPYHRQFLALHA